MGSKLSIEDIKQHATLLGGEFLSLEYINSNTKSRWRCKEGHEWEARPANILYNKSWCPICRKKEGGKKRRLGINFMKRFANSQEGELLSSEYETNSKKLKWRCKKGHEFTESYQMLQLAVKRGYTWCPKCANRRKIKITKGLKYSINDMQAIARSRGGYCLSPEYLGYGIKLKWRCKEGHEWWAPPGNVKFGSWCRLCGAKRSAKHNRKPIEEIQAFARAKGGKLISKQYFHSHKKLEWECAKGHRWFSAWDTVSSGCWCPKCAKRYYKIENLRKLARKRGYEIISNEVKDPQKPLKLRCKNNHVFEFTRANY